MTIKDNIQVVINYCPSLFIYQTTNDLSPLRDSEISLHENNSSRIALRNSNFCMTKQQLSSNKTATFATQFGRFYEAVDSQIVTRPILNDAEFEKYLHILKGLLPQNTKQFVMAEDSVCLQMEINGWLKVRKL